MVPNEKKVLLGIGVVSLVLAGVGAFGIHYALGKVSEEETAIHDLQGKIKEARGKIAQIPADEKDVIILRENVKEYAKILPDEKEVTEYARTLAHYSSQAGMVLTSLSPEIRQKRKGTFQPIRYKMKLQGSLWQLMRLINLLENHPRFMQVKNIRLSAARKAKTAGDAVHTVDLTVETYYYNKTAKGKTQVKIPNYQSKKTDLEEAIHNARSRFEEDKYSFKGPSGRRDIFVDPRLPSQGAEGKGRLPRKQQQMIVDACRRLLAEIVEIKKRMDGNGPDGTRPNIIQRFELGKEMAKRIGILRNKIQQIEEQGLLSYAPLHSQLVTSVKEPLEKLVASSKAKRPESEFLGVDALERIKKSMEDALDLGDLDLAVERYRLAQHKIGPDDFGTPKRKRLVKIIKGLYRKALVAQEFARKKIKITGRILRPDGLSLVIINGKSYFEGDPVEDDLYVKSLTPDSVEFIYKGVVISKKI